MHYYAAFGRGFEFSGAQGHPGRQLAEGDSKRREEKGKDRGRSHAKNPFKDKKSSKSSCSDSDSSNSYNPEVEDRYCKGCEDALARCRHRDQPDDSARTTVKKYFIFSPLCSRHFDRNNIVKDEKLITLKELWKEMKAKEPCLFCAGRQLIPMPRLQPLERAKNEGEKYFIIRPFCELHQSRVYILDGDEVVSVRRYWKRLKKNEICWDCDDRKRSCRPFPAPNDRAPTEGEKYFQPSPLCLQHIDRRMIPNDGRMISIKDYWKERVKRAKQEARKRAEMSRQQSTRMPNVPLEEERGRRRESESHRMKAAGQPNLLSPNYAAAQRDHSRGRARSTTDPCRLAEEARYHPRGRSVGVAPSHRENHRKSRSPSPYPADWTGEEWEKYLEGFRGLVQSRQEQKIANDLSAQFPSPPALPVNQTHRLYPPTQNPYHGQYSPPAPIIQSAPLYPSPTNPSPNNVFQHPAHAQSAALHPSAQGLYHGHHFAAAPIVQSAPLHPWATNFSSNYVFQDPSSIQSAPLHPSTQNPDHAHSSASTPTVQNIPLYPSTINPNPRHYSLSPPNVQSAPLHPSTESIDHGHPSPPATTVQNAPLCPSTNINPRSPSPLPTNVQNAPLSPPTTNAYQRNLCSPPSTACSSDPKPARDNGVDSVSPISAISGSHQEAGHDQKCRSDGSENTLPSHDDRKHDDRSLVEKLVIRSLPSAGN